VLPLEKVGVGWVEWSDVGNTVSYLLCELIACMESGGLIVDCMCVSVVRDGPVAGSCRDGEKDTVGGRLDGMGDGVGTRELVVGIAVESAVGIVGSACVVTADDSEKTGDDVTSGLVRSTEGCGMKELEVAPTIVIGAVV